MTMREPTADIPPALSWRPPDGDGGALDLSSAVFGVSALGALFIGLSGLAAGDGARTIFLALMVVLLAASAATRTDSTWALWLRLAAATCGVLVWSTLVLSVRSSEPIAVATMLGFAAGCSWLAWSLVGRPELWPISAAAETDRRMGWIEEAPP